MNDSIQVRVEKAKAALEATQAQIAQIEEKMRAATSKVRSRDRSVEVSVGPRGELQKIRFLENKYRTMTESQLAASVMEAVQNAQGRIAKRVMEAYSPLTEGLSDVPGLDPERIDMEKFFGPLTGAAEKGRPAPTPTRTRLRDEIHEDQEQDGNDHGGKR